MTRLRLTTLQSDRSASPFNVLHSELQRSACSVLRLLPSWTLKSGLHVWEATLMPSCHFASRSLGACDLSKQRLTYSKYKKQLLCAGECECLWKLDECQNRAALGIKLVLPGESCSDSRAHNHSDIRRLHRSVLLKHTCKTLQQCCRNKYQNGES